MTYLEMTYFPQALPPLPAPRFRLADVAPAVLQLDDGRRTSSEVRVISHTGGLLSLPTPLEQGSIVKLMFGTYRGPVFGTAEMLFPITSTQQPSRFVALSESDQSTLQAAFQSPLYRNTDEWIEEFKAAVMNWNPRPWKTRFGAILAVVTLAALCLGSAVYLFSAHLR